MYPKMICVAARAVRCQPGVHTNRVTPNVAQKWAMRAKCNNWVVLFVCMGKTPQGHYFGRIGHNGCMHMKVSHCNVLSPFVSTAPMSMISKPLEPGRGVFYPGTTHQRVPATVVSPDCVAIQYEGSGHSHPHCPSDHLTFRVVRAESSLGPESHFSRTRIWSRWQGVWAATTINTRGMRCLEWERPSLHANPFGHSVAACLPKGCMLRKNVTFSDTCGAHGTRGAISAPLMVVVMRHLCWGSPCTALHDPLRQPGPPTPALCMGAIMYSFLHHLMDICWGLLGLACKTRRLLQERTASNGTSTNKISDGTKIQEWEAGAACKVPPREGCTCPVDAVGRCLHACLWRPPQAQAHGHEHDILGAGTLVDYCTHLMTTFPSSTRGGKRPGFISQLHVLCPRRVGDAHVMEALKRRSGP